MSLPKQAINVGLLILADSDTTNNRVEYQITVQNKDINIQPEFFSGGAFDESIGGKRISNLRGYRVTLDLRFDASREFVQKTVGTGGSATDSTFREMFNELMSCFSNDQIIETLTDQGFDKLCVRIDQADGTSDPITISNASGTLMGFIPENLTYTQTYSNQIGRFIPSITLVSEDLMPSIPEELQGVL